MANSMQFCRFGLSKESFTVICKAVQSAQSFYITIHGYIINFGGLLNKMTVQSARFLHGT